MTRREKKLELLSAYFDGEATESERQVVEILLRTDTEAQSIMADFQGMRHELTTLPSSTPPLDLGALVTETLEREALFNGIPNEPRLATWQVYGAAAAFVLAVSMSYWFYPYLSRPTAPTGEQHAHQPNNPSAISSPDRLNRNASAQNSSGNSASTAMSTTESSAPSTHQEPYDVITGLMPGTTDDRSGINKLKLAAPRPGSLDEKLVVGQLLPQEVRLAAANAFSNQIIVDIKHASDRWILEDALEAELYKNDTPRLGPSTSTMPLTCDDAFFAKCHPQKNSRDAEAANVTTFALNIPLDEAETLLAEFNDIAAETGIDADVFVNGVALGPRPDPKVALGNCIAFTNDIKDSLPASFSTAASRPLAKSSADGERHTTDDSSSLKRNLDSQPSRNKIFKTFDSTTQASRNDKNSETAVCENLMICISLRDPGSVKVSPAGSRPTTRPAE